jgi:hypothetical protein
MEYEIIDRTLKPDNKAGFETFQEVFAYRCTIQKHPAPQSSDVYVRRTSPGGGRPPPPASISRITPLSRLLSADGPPTTLAIIHSQENGPSPKTWRNRSTATDQRECELIGG